VASQNQLLKIVHYLIPPVPFRNRERITFDHLVSMKKPEETAVLKVLRDGKEQELGVTLRPVSPCNLITFDFNLYF
jgi:hypothetical protein